MWRILYALAVTCLVAHLLASLPVKAANGRVKVVAHPARSGKLTEGEIRAIYLKQKLLWNDGRPIIPINREAGSSTRELFSMRIFGQDSRRLATYWNQRYFEAGEFPPATLASEEAVIRFVAGNENAIGYVGPDTATDAVTVVLVLE
jgi:ABC-type phosphate transport system substrate-binding protein